MSVNFQQLELLVNQNKGHLYHYGKDGIIITNASGKEMIHLPSHEDSNVDSKNVEQVKTFFSDLELQQANQENPLPKSMIWLDMEDSVLADTKQQTSCVQSLRKMTEQYLCTLRIHFDKDPISWQELLSSFIEQLKDKKEKSTVSLQLYGTFAPMDDAAMEFLFNNRIQLHYVSDVRTFSQNKESICQLSEYGFSVPCVWYVDNENINLISSLFDDATEWNYDTGFALPLASERFIGRVQTNPSSVDYLRLILDVYKTYPCYDEMFYPMNMALLDSIGDTNNTASKTWRWERGHSSFCEYFHETSVEKIHKILHHCFIWQRHIVKNRLNTFFPQKQTGGDF